jgi:hypothetical protein
MKKYIICSISALIIEICSTFYISFVSGRNVLGMVFFAGIGPFLGLPFFNYMIEAKSFRERFVLAFWLSFGYMAGSLFVSLFLETAYYE